MRNLITFICSLVFAIFLTVISASAQLDPTFGVGGKFIRTATGNETVIESFMLPDGKFLVLTANTGSTPWPVRYDFVRFNSDGTTDVGYGTNGSVQLPIPFISTGFLNYGINDAVRQSDGNIVLVGFDNSDGLVVRLHENGTLDTSFSGDGIHRPNINQTDTDVLSRVLYQADGKLLAAGHSSTGATNRLLLIRYQTDGSLDTSFGGGAGFVVHPIIVINIVGLERQSGGSYVALSRGWSGAPVVVGKVYRFSVDGAHDSGFASPEFGDQDATRLTRLANDQVLVGGNPYISSDSLFRFHSNIRLTRLNAGGGTDTSFGTNGSVVLDFISGMTDVLSDVVELGDGSIAVASSTLLSKNRSASSGQQMSLLKLGSGGTITGRYLVSGLGDFGQCAGLVLQPDGKLVVYGSSGGFQTNDVLLARVVGVPLTTPRFRGIPFEFSSSSGGPFGISHLAVFRPSSVSWFASPMLSGGVPFGSPTGILVAGDYFGDYQTELAVYLPASGTWNIAKTYGGASSNFASIRWGSPGDIPAPYDFDGDGKYDLTVFRPTEGNWYIRGSIDISVRIEHWGANGDKPVVGDYDGDGLADLAVWRPSTGVWYVLRSSDGQAHIVAFGLDGDVPVQEDYDGDLKTDIAVFRRSTGVWYIWRSSDGGFTIMPFGLSEDIPAPADYDGDRKMDIAVYRPSTSRWYWIKSGTGVVEQADWGVTGDIAVQGRY